MELIQMKSNTNIIYRLRTKDSKQTISHNKDISCLTVQ